MKAIPTLLAAALAPLLVFGDDILVSTGTVVAVARGSLVVDDGQRLLSAYSRIDKILCKRGDRVAVDYLRHTNPDGFVYQTVRSITPLGKGSAPEPPLVTIRQALDEQMSLRPIRLRGVLEDIYDDEMSPGNVFAVLRADGASVVLSENARDTVAQALQSLLFAEIEVTGFLTGPMAMARQFAEPYFFRLDGTPITVISPAAKDSFDVPTLGIQVPHTPSGISALGPRKVTGRVVAAWGRNNFLLDSGKTGGERLHRVELSGTQPLPACGSSVEVVGYPETDLIRINFSRARYRAAEGVAASDAPKPLTVDDLLFKRNEPTFYRHHAYGKEVRVSGEVRSLPQPGDADYRFYLSCEGLLLPVDASGCPDALNGLMPGCRLSLAGIAVFECDNWRPSAPLPKVRGLMLVLRSPADLKIVARPPWWTVDRLLLLLGVALAGIVLVLVWNRALNRIAARRGRELADEQLGHSLSELKLGERTRLAVELHDSLSQNLAGVACQVGALNNELDGEPALVRRRLRTIGRMLESTRSELRNCLFDLRSDIIDEPDFAQAIRRMTDESDLDADVVIRFNVPRERLLDSTAHAMLSIIRELAGNAVRHGRATRLHVAGSLEDGRLLFSVRDNGAGFDPASAPGLADGHFGLEGIRNRVAMLGGTFAISSIPGRGARAVVAIPLPASHQEKE